jgi:hypothetical protein
VVVDAGAGQRLLREARDGTDGVALYLQRAWRVEREEGVEVREDDLCGS